jgi:hypothetical protein
VIRAISATLLLSSLLNPARVSYWVSTPGEYDFVVKAHLGGDHERICGVVTVDGTLWDTMTIRSAGARIGIAKDGLPLDAAKLAVEQDCR